jgi:Ni,Fe-hydrogenase III large subunit/Ni,Fe-hydrogenase III component G
MNWEQIIAELKSKLKINDRDIQVNHPGEIYIDVQGDPLSFCTLVIEEYNGALIALFANDERKIHGHFLLYYAFSLGNGAPLLTFRLPVSPETAVTPSIAFSIPVALFYEMEIRDLFGIQFNGHPDPNPLIFHTGIPVDGYPLRGDFPRRKTTSYKPVAKEYSYINGTGVYEIPVGPVHAGIIEPGHFRFSVAGEPIIHLEAELYYVHKGLETLAAGQTAQNVLLLSERISGDETFSNSLAYCLALEKIAGLSHIPERAAYSRMIFAELERLYNHLGDLAGVCLDIAYGFAASQFAMMRRWCQMANEQMTGSRFLRNVNRPGGLRKDFLNGFQDDQKNILTELLGKLEPEFADTVKIVKQNSLYIDRVENTGVIKKEIAQDLHAVGPAARSIGIGNDARQQFPYLYYLNINFDVHYHNMGDVNCRVNVKIDEILESIRIIHKALQQMPAHGEVRVPIGGLKPYQSAFGITESPRGENVHWVMTGLDQTIFRYKVRTPSFCNWPVLCQAVKGNIVPDFPLINKSFNLSYSGNDL